MSDLLILSKFTVGGQELKNRLVLAPMTRARCTPTEDPFDITSTIPNDLMAEHYEQRASAGLLVTEATGISEEGYGWRNAPQICGPEHVAGWKQVVDRVHDKEGIIYLQLWHMGRQAHSSYHRSTNRIVAPSAIAVPGQVRNVHGEHADYEVPHAMTIEEIKSTVQDFANAAKLAKEAGFDGVEVHSANGYLIDQFLQSSTNQRTDMYGGSMENRVRFLKEVVEAIIDSGAYPANRIGFRLSPNGVFGGMGSDDNDKMFPFVAKEMNPYGLAYMHVMDGTNFGYHNLCKAVTLADMRKNFDGPIISNVTLTKEIAEGIVRSGSADLVCFGRKYISNPDLAERFANGWPLNEDPPHETWWYPTGASGYTDWPFYKADE